MTASRESPEKRLSQLKREVQARGFQRHPSLLKNISDLPAGLRSPAVESLVAGNAVQTIIYFPPQIQRGWHYVPGQALLFTPDRVIHLLASIWSDQEPRVTSLENRGLMYLQVTLLLLYGSLEIVAQAPGSPARLGMEFNAVFWDLLSPSFGNLLQASQTLSAAPADTDASSPALRQALDELPLKFSNGARLHGLLPGEALHALVFQPGTWRRWLLLFRKPVTADTLLLLSTNYLVVIQEELGVAQGWIISYIPRNCISGIQDRARGLWNELTVQLQREGQTAEYKLLLERSSAQTWRGHWVQHGSLWHDLPEVPASF